MNCKCGSHTQLLYLLGNAFPPINLIIITARYWSMHKATSNIRNIILHNRTGIPENSITNKFLHIFLELFYQSANHNSKLRLSLRIISIISKALAY